jgi:hypothetical protein
VRKIAAVVVLIAVWQSYASAASKPTLSGLEQIVTCEETPEAGAAIMALENTNLYGTKNDRFFYPLKPESVFGMDVRWVGYGVMDQPGPNVTLAGKLDVLKLRVEAALDKKMECKDEGCFWQKSEYRVVLIYPHQADKSLIILQCAYNDP